MVIWNKIDNKDNLICFLKSRGISTGCHYTPLHMQPLFKKSHQNAQFQNTNMNVVSLPYHPGLSDYEINYVIESLNEFELQSIN